MSPLKIRILGVDRREIGGTVVTPVTYAFPALSTAMPYASISTSTAQIGGIQHLCAAGVKLGHEGISPPEIRILGVDRREIGGSMFSGDIRIAGAVHGDAVAIIISLYRPDNSNTPIPDRLRVFALRYKPPIENRFVGF